MIRRNAVVAWGIAGMLACACSPTPAQEVQAKPKQPRAGPVGRPVRVVSIAFSGKSLDDVVTTVDQEGSKGADIILLPEVWLYENKPGINVSRITLDLDRGIYSTDFNMEKRDKLLREHADDIAMDKWMPREAWFVLKAKRPGVSARKLAAEYGLEELRPYLARSRREADRLRGWEFPGSPNTPAAPSALTSPRKSG